MHPDTSVVCLQSMSLGGTDVPELEMQTGASD